MTLKENLIALIERAEAEEINFVAGLDLAALNDPGAPDRWSARDTIAHNAAWKDRMAEIIEVGRRGEVVPETGDTDTINAGFYEKYSRMPWDDVVVFSRQAAERLIAATRAIPDDELLLPSTHPDETGRPLWRRIAGNGFSHPLAHLAALYGSHGQEEATIRVQEEGARLLMELSPEPGWQGTAIYNLACFYALNRRKDRALSLLSRALALAPDLLAWSREDPDLLSLHGEPQYEALYERIEREKKTL